MTLDKNFNQEILGKIKEEKIKPKWHFLIKDYVVWFIGFLSLFVGSASFSVILFLLKNNDWEIYNQIGESFVNFILLTMPYFWIILLFFFSFLVYYNIKHTKKGYKYSLPLIVSINIFLSIILGGLFYKAGVGQAIDDVLSEKAPLYAEVINRTMSHWNNPKDGYLAGFVSQIKNKNEFILMDFKENEWTILNKNENNTEIIEKRPLRITGKVISENTFEAYKIFPAPKPGRGLFRKHEIDHMRRNSFMQMKRKLNIENTDNIESVIDKYPELKEQIQRKMDAIEKSGTHCKKNEDYIVPFDYAIRSICPFESKCLDEECTTVCHGPHSLKINEKEIIPECTKDDDCNCSHYTAEDKTDCRCLNGLCGAIVN